MSEKLSKNEKQQYLEGPWNRVSGNVPLTQFELDGWKEDLDKMYGEANWQALPNTKNSDAYDITVSPDHNNVYAAVVRNVDKEGLGGLPASDPAVKAILGQVALEEAQTQTHQSAHIEAAGH
jgi:hypothetical protein